MKRGARDLRAELLWQGEPLPHTRLTEDQIHEILALDFSATNTKKGVTAFPQLARYVRYVHGYVVVAAVGRITGLCTTERYVFDRLRHMKPSLVTQLANTLFLNLRDRDPETIWRDGSFAQRLAWIVRRTNAELNPTNHGRWEHHLVLNEHGRVACSGLLWVKDPPPDHVHGGAEKGPYRDTPVLTTPVLRTPRCMTIAAQAHRLKMRCYMLNAAAAVLGILCTVRARPEVPMGLRVLSVFLGGMALVALPFAAKRARWTLHSHSVESHDPLYEIHPTRGKAQCAADRAHPDLRDHLVQIGLLLNPVAVGLTIQYLWAQGLYMRLLLCAWAILLLESLVQGARYRFMLRPDSFPHHGVQTP